MNINEKIIKNYDEYAFGKYIRSRREKLGISCRSLASMLQISPVYLSDIERGRRKSPINSKIGKDYIGCFIKYLQISEEEISEFYKMAAATRGISRELEEYLKDNKYALIAVQLAKEINLSDKEWQNVILYIEKIKK